MYLERLQNLNVCQSCSVVRPDFCLVCSEMRSFVRSEMPRNEETVHTGSFETHRYISLSGPTEQT